MFMFLWASMTEEESACLKRQKVERIQSKYVKDQLKESICQFVDYTWKRLNMCNILHRFQKIFQNKINTYKTEA